MHRALLFVLLFAYPAVPQTSCADQHTDAGVFVCYPNPSIYANGMVTGRLFHLSAQANALPDQTITAYKIWIDDRLIDDAQQAAHAERFSFETGLASPFTSGVHSLRVEMVGAGSATVKNVQFMPEKDPNLCDPFSRFDPRACTLLAHSDSLQWPLPNGSNFYTYLDLYRRNLKALELDTADAVALDSKGNLYVASHALSDIDIARYAPDGSLIFSSLIRACGKGFMFGVAVSVDEAGYPWIAGNTDACLSGPADAGASGVPGFVILVDTAKPSSSPPLYIAHIAQLPHRLSGMVVDRARNVYLVGNSESAGFPHQASLSIPGVSRQSGLQGPGFVMALNSSGSGPRWSTLLLNFRTSAVSIDDSGDVYLAGRAGTEIAVARIDGDGRNCRTWSESLA